MARNFSNFMEGYLEYTSKQESPEQFHVWSAISIIASALGRSCWMNRGYYTLFPNMYVVLVAESALCRKSTSTKLAMQLLRYTGKDIINEKLTMAYLYKHLAKASKGTGTDAALVIYAPELGVFLGSDAHATGLVAAITSLYDCPEIAEYLTKNSGQDVIHNPVINILGATTLDWMSTNLPGESVEGGFTSRVIFVVEDAPRHRIAWPKVTSVETDLKSKLIEDLLQINALKGQFKVTDEAMEMFNTWYIECKEPDDPRLRGFFGRKGDHILKAAMIMSVATRDDLLLDAIHIDLAIQAIEKVEKKMPIAFRGVAFSKSAKNVDRILSQIEKAGGKVEHAKLLKKNSCYLNGKEFAEVIQTLIDSEQIFPVLFGNKKGYVLNGGIK